MRCSLHCDMQLATSKISALRQKDREQGTECLYLGKKQKKNKIRDILTKHTHMHKLFLAEGTWQLETKL